MDQEQAGPVSIKFTTHTEFEEQFRALLPLCQHELRLFDPNFSAFPLGASDVDTALRHFLREGGKIKMAMHSSTHLEQHCPRFMRLLKDYSHRIQAKLTPRALHLLADSFVMGDDRYIVRRFHADHMRGEAAFDMPEALELPAKRFEEIWMECPTVMHATASGL